VAIGVSANQLAGDLGTKHRCGDDAKVMLDCGKVETREVVELDPRRIGQNRLEIGRIKRAARPEADKVLIPPAIGYLDQTQAIPRGYQPHGLGIDSDGTLGEHAFGEIFFVEIDSHIAGMLRLIEAVWKAPA
jgi:hypothetical protein